MVINITGQALGKKDALHLASAIEVKCDYFITVDKGILRKAKQLEGIVVCNPIEFIDIWEDNNVIRYSNKTKRF